MKEQIINDGQKTQEKERVGSPVRNRENARAKWNLKREKSLEESWLSLTLFNRFQKGRLSIDLEGTTCFFVDKYDSMDAAKGGPLMPLFQNPGYATVLYDLILF